MKKIPTKCINCAKISAQEAQEVNASCWDTTVCYSRRSHAKNKERRNQTRNIKRQKEILEEIIVEHDINIYSAVLTVYRKKGNNTSIYAMEVTIFKDSNKEAFIKPVLTAGWKKKQISNYIESILNTLNDKYNINKFSSLITLDTSLCPIK